MRETGKVDLTARAGGSAFFCRLQLGKYTLAVTAPGAAQYGAYEIVVGETTVVHRVKLQPGRSVRGTAVRPDGTRCPLKWMARLFRDGVEHFVGSADEWEGVAYGKYTVRIPSTREDEERSRKAGMPTDRIAVEDGIDSREVSFVIDASTPETLDLGEIAVCREKR